MSIPYHTHKFDIEPATNEEVKEGILDNKVVAPSSLGSAAAYSMGYFATAAQGKRADEAVAKRDVGVLAYKDRVTVHDINTSGDPCENTVLSGTGWIKLSPLGIGDMSASIYDPTNVRSDAFSMENMIEGEKHLILTPQERIQITKVSQIEQATQQAQTTADSAKQAADKAQKAVDLIHPLEKQDWINGIKTENALISPAHLVASIKANGSSSGSGNVSAGTSKPVEIFMTESGEIAWPEGTTEDTELEVWAWGGGNAGDDSAHCGGNGGCCAYVRTKKKFLGNSTVTIGKGGKTAENLYGKDTKVGQFMTASGGFFGYDPAGIHGARGDNGADAEDQNNIGGDGKNGEVGRIGGRGGNGGDGGRGGRGGYGGRGGDNFLRSAGNGGNGGDGGIGANNGKGGNGGGGGNGGDSIYGGAGGGAGGGRGGKGKQNGNNGVRGRGGHSMWGGHGGRGSVGIDKSYHGGGGGYFPGGDATASSSGAGGDGAVLIKVYL